MPIDRERINKLLEDIESQAEFMEGLTAGDVSEFLACQEKVYGLRYSVIRAVEAMASVCIHLMARLYQRTTESYGECFQILGEKGIISPDLARRIAAMARLRNLLVHRYWDVDDSRVFSYCKEGVRDLHLFTSSVARFLGGLGEP